MPRTNVVGTPALPGSGAQRCAQAGEREHRIDSTAGTAATATQSSPFHPLADRFPPIEGVEFDELVADIKANGLIELLVMLDGMILDGRNRYRACVAADVEPTFRPFTGDDPAAYVISANIHRRHLTPEQKRDLIAMLLRTDPGKSDRQIAEAAKASPTTVGKVRAKMEPTVQPGQLKRIGKDGKARQQPATKPKLMAEVPNEGRRTRLERELDAGAFDRLRVEQQHNGDLAEQLRLAEIKIAGLESENEELKAECDRLHQSLAEAHAANLALIEQLKVHVPVEPPVTFGDPGPIPELLRRDRVSS